MASVWRTLGRLSARGLSVPGGAGASGVSGAAARGAVILVAAFLALAVAPHTTTTEGGLLAATVGLLGVNSSIRIGRAYAQRVHTVFGEYRGPLDPGLDFVPPFVTRVYAFDMRTQTLELPRQEAITRDNSPVAADAVVYLRVADAEKAFLEVDDYRRATSTLAQTTLRAVVGDMDLDEMLSRRDRINARVREQLDDPTDAWGVRVEAVEVREIDPSADVRRAMERQSSAERRRRATILEAQGERRSAVERAEGEKRANVVRAQGTKQSQILEAQGEAVSTVLRARAAESMGERGVVERGMETLERIGEGESTTFVLPQELTSLLGRDGRRRTGSDARAPGRLDARALDEETRDLLDLDDVEAVLDDGERRPIGDGER
ncbi:MAG: SPFH domain-containing protein [Salinigranum sp.]